MSDGNLTASNDESIGYSGTGTFTQTGGTNTVSSLSLGYNSGASGTYNLSDTGKLSASYEYIGRSGTGTGTFTQTGGTNSTSTLYLGYSSRASGAYNLSDTGKLSASSEYIGYSGTGTFTQTGGTNSSSTLYLGYYSGASGAYNLSDTGKLSASYEYIGGSGTGTFTQTGGSNTVSSLNLGSSIGASGTYNLSGTGQLSASFEDIGRSGTGTFTQTGGTNSITYDLDLGYNSGSSGTYNLSGTGQLSACSEYIGYSGTGTFTQTGGVNTATYIKIGTNGKYALTAGTLNISGGGGFENQGIWDLSNSSALINATSAIVDLSSAVLTNAQNASLNLDAHSLLIVAGGFDPAGYFTSYANAGLLHQTGSTLDISPAYSIYGAGSISGHVNCQGTFSATSGYAINLNGGLTISGTGTVNLVSGGLYVNDATSGMSGGKLNAHNQYIGSTGAGTFTQSGGTNTITNFLYLGYYYSASGTYNLGGTGKLSASVEYIGNSGTGTFTQTGGANTAAYIKIGASGTYTLTAGTLNISSGFENQGVWDLSNSSAVINASSAIVDLSSAVLNDAQNASLNLDAHSLLIVPGGFDPADYFTSYANVGLSHQTGSTLDISSTYSIYGAGSISDHVNCLGTLSATSGYAINLNGGLTILGSGSVNLRAGKLYVNDASSGISGGSLYVSNQYIDSTGTGMFTQNGGKNSISSSLYMGYNTGYSGAYYLSGTGSLTVTGTDGEYIGYQGTGTFTQTGGTNSITSYLYLGYNSGASGTYNLSGTGQLSAYFEYIGYSGTSTFTQTGGSNTVSFLRLGDYYGASGTYNLSGTGKLSVGDEYIGYSGTGTFTQTGGTNTITYDLYLGYNSGASGAYNLSGTGKLSASWEYIGGSGTGTFTQTSGTNSAYYLYLGYISGSNGSYNLSNTGKLSAYYEYIGCSGTGTFTQTGGTNTISSSLYMGYNTGSSGAYYLSGTGSLTVTGTGGEYIGYSGNGTFVQSGGTHTVNKTLYLANSFDSTASYTLSGTCKLSASSEYIGHSGTGMFTQTGGSNTVSSSLDLGTSIGASGTYNLSGTGQLSAGSECIGGYGTGTFTQTGGTNSSSTLYLGLISGASGTYNLSDTGKLSANEECIGRSGTGTFTQTGGTNTVSSSLYLGHYSGSSGVYYLNGGTLITKSILIGSGTAAFNFGGGMLRAGGNFTCTLPITLTGAGGAANIDTAGYSITLSGAISGAGGLNKLGSGTLFLTGSNSYTGGTNVSAGTLAMNNFYINDVYSRISAGSISSTNQYTGYSDNGTFTQTGGTNTVLSTLYIGYNSGGSGTYNLNGGTLILKSLSKGSGTAAFNFGGGTLRASGSFACSLPMTLTGEGGNANIDTAGYTVTMSGILSGDGGLNKLGSGTLTLTASETYSGNTTVNGGTLIFAGGIASGGTSLIDVESGAAVLKTKNVSKSDLDVYTAASGVFEVADHTHTVGNISGSGSTKVDAGASLIVKSISQGALTIGAGGMLTIRPTVYSWNGGGADNLWTNNDNWDVDMAPTISDNIILSAGAAKLLNYNDFAPDIEFDSLTVSASGYNIQGNALHSAKVTVLPGVSFQCKGIYANTLTIGNGATVTIEAISGGPQGGEITPVPEPGAWILLAAACLAMLAYRRAIGCRL
jgi:fibronectin-binding autotransporter adhesin